jgi:hypothetical protein
MRPRIPKIFRPKGNDFKSISAFNSEWADRIAFLILVGLAVDIAEVIILGKAWIEFALTILASSLIMAGVWGELYFLKRARAADDNRVAQAEQSLTEALNRAARAEEQLAPRNITEEQYNALQELKGKVSIICMVTPSDFEATRFAAQIGQALVAAGIDVRVGQQRIGMIWTELYIVIPESVPDFRQVELYDIFRKAKFSVGCGDRSHVPMMDLPPDIPIIMVGVKRLQYGGIPFAWTLSVPVPSQPPEPSQATE